MPSLIEAKRENLNKQIVRLSVQHTEVSNALLLENNPMTRGTLKLQLQTIEKEWAEAQEELDRLDAQDTGADSGLRLRQQDQFLREKLARLDFRQARRICRQTILHNDLDQPVALIMVHNVDEMEGDLYVDDLKQSLKKFGWDNRQFRRVPVEFGLMAQFSDEALLNKLAPYFDVEPDPDLTQFTQKLIETICDEIVPKSTLLFEFRLISDPFKRQEFPKWFMKNFWHPLVQRFQSMLTQKPLAKLIALMVVHPSVGATKLETSYFCTEEQFAAERILHLPLGVWPEGDILRWLQSLLLGKKEWTPEKIKTLAQTIFDLSQGHPQEVSRLIMKDKIFRQAL